MTRNSSNRPLRARLALSILLALPALASAASWTQVTQLAPGSAETMLLLTDGTVMVHTYDSPGKAWFQLTPSATGSYIDGSWSVLPNMGTGRLYFASHVLPNGNVWVLGGEYSDPNFTASWTRTGETFDTLNRRWAAIAPHPEANYGDVPSMLLDKNRILAGSLSGRSTYYYDIAKNSWSLAANKVYNDQSDEESWVKLPDGTILTYDIFQSIGTGGAYAEVFDPATSLWSSRSPSDGTASGSIPQLSSSAVGFELGAALNLRGKGKASSVFVIGASGHTATYSPTTKTWKPGPDIIGTLPDGRQVLFGADDAPAAVLPNGHVIFAADAGPTTGVFSGPTQLFEYDPTANTITPSLPALPVALSGSSYGLRLLVLPTGQVMITTGDNAVWVYTPDGSPNPKFKPVVSSVRYNGAGSFTLKGRQLNGSSAGASYGDDAEMDENYPILSLKDAASGNVWYTRTSNWSTTGVTPKKAEKVDFTLKTGTPAGTLVLTATGAGVSGDPICLTLTADEAAGTGVAADVPLFACP